MTAKLDFNEQYLAHLLPTTWKLEDFRSSQISSQTLILIMLTTLVIIWRLTRKTVNLPPGFIGLPILGYLPFLVGHKNRFARIIELAKTQGKIFRINMGMVPAMWLNDWETIKHNIVKRGDVFSGRPWTLIFEKNYGFKDIVTGHGPIYKEQRRFTLQQLRNFGFGKKSLDDIVMQEVEELVTHLDKKSTRVVKISNLFFVPIMNIVWGITSGRHYGFEDDHISLFKTILKENFKFLSAGTLMNFVPIARFLPSSNYKGFLENTRLIHKFLNEEIVDHEKTMTEGESRHFIDVYLKEILNRTEKERVGTPYQRDRLMQTLSDLFAAGVDTTGDTLEWFFLYMATWPEIQRKVQQEIDDVIGKSRFPTYEDRLHLPYTEATICEAQRYCNTVPFSVPHSPLKTVEVEGYTVPKGSYVLMNLYAVHNDAKLWGDPENFRPERFIGDDGAVHKPEYFIPYSVGPRMCLGESLARVELFQFFTCMLQRYNFSYVTGQKPPSLKPVWAVTLRPKPFSLQIDSRE